MLNGLSFSKIKYKHSFIQKYEAYAEYSTSFNIMGRDKSYYMLKYNIINLKGYEMLRILKKILKNRRDFNNKTLKYLEEIDEKHHKKILKKHKDFEKEQAVFEAQSNFSNTITDEELDEILNLRKKGI